MARIRMALLLVSAAGCASLPVFRHSGPTADTVTRGWRTTILRRGRDGDWLIVRGYNSAAHLVAVAGTSEYSHAGILDVTRREVIEAVDPAVRAIPLDELLADCDRVSLVRPRGVDRQAARRALAKARSQIGAPYDLAGTMGLPDRSAFYCSELAAWSIGRKVDREGTENVLHPAALRDLGTVLFESESRSIE